MEELELVKKAGMGDVDAFTELYRGIYKDLYRTAFYMLGNPHDAEDVVSETVVDAFSSIGQLREAGAFRAWIFRILAVKCSRKRREYLKRTEELPEDLAEKNSFVEDVMVRQAFAKLPKEDRMILSLHVFGGYKSSEIAAMLSRNENTVRSKKSRALTKLAAMLKA